MAKAEKSKATDLVPKNDSLPAFMQEDMTSGTEELGQYMTPPRIKIVQKMSGPPFDERFEPGDVVIVPHLLLVSEYAKGKPTPVYFTPIFFFVEWCVWNPIEMKSTLPAIRERTFDKTSDLVAMSRDPKQRTFPCPENNEYNCRICEHLNFVVIMHGADEFKNVPVIVSFSRAEHRSGSNLASIIRMRNAPIYGCNFCMSVSQRTGPKGVWHGFDVENPLADSGVTPFVMDEGLFVQYRKLHEELKEAHKNNMIRVDYADEDTEGVSNSPDEF